MSKIKSIICSCFITFILLCGLIVPILPTPVLAEEQSSQKYSLLSPLYNQNPSQTLSKYNISIEQTHSFTPFDFEKKERLEGMSFVLPTEEERNQIVEKYVTLDEVSDVSMDKDISLNIWIYFDTIYLHNLTLTLELENNETITWFLSATKLYSLVSSTGVLAIDSLPYGFVKFDLPIREAQCSGVIEEQNKLISPKKLTIDFTSTVTEIEGFSNLIFYDVYLAESKSTTATVQKQGYRFYSLNFFKQEILDSLVVGDSLNIPAKDRAIEYAWDGDSDLYELSNKQTPYVTWKVLLKDPSNDNIEYKTFGDKITFTKEGTYQLYYQCYNTSLSNDKPIVSASIAFTVGKLKPIIFGSSLKNIEVGKTYTLYLRTSSIFDTVSDFSFTSTTGLEVNYLGEGVVEIKATKEGKHTLTAKVNATRVVEPTDKEYSSTFKVEAVKVDEDNKTVFKIVLWSVLGVIFVVFIAIGIKSLVKANKNDVK